LKASAVLRDGQSSAPSKAKAGSALTQRSTGCGGARKSARSRPAAAGGQKRK
jgi:hypothetical protein